MNSLLATELLLEQTRSIIDKNHKNSEETGGLFNVFSILNMERLEVKTHSAFLYELLNPKGSHSQGNAYLKLFIHEVLKIKDYDFYDVKVVREKSINNLGRIDLVIENSDLLIIIEMKIDADDQEDQLFRYNKYGLSHIKKHKIYYLSLFGYEASNYSTGHTELKYECISFESNILNWIKLKN